MIRIAAVGDVHYDSASKDRLRSQFATLQNHADLFLIAGDLTQRGSLEEAQALATDLRAATIPVVAVLGNHDYHQSLEDEIREVLRKAHVIILEGDTAEFRIGEKTVGVVGLKGFGGGFFGACITEFGEPEIKAFARHSKDQAEILRRGLQSLKTDFKFVLLHFAPIEATLLGERREIFPFLGSYLLAEVIDEIGADAIFHGHAHLGTEKGTTPGGVPVRNVAHSVIRHAYNIYNFDVPFKQSAITAKSDEGRLKKA